MGALITSVENGWEQLLLIAGDYCARLTDKWSIILAWQQSGVGACSGALFSGTKKVHISSVSF